VSSLTSIPLPDEIEDSLLVCERAAQKPRPTFLVDALEMAVGVVVCLLSVEFLDDRTPALHALSMTN
jgi:hypothetical protein